MHEAQIRLVDLRRARRWCRDAREVRPRGYARRCSPGYRPCGDIGRKVGNGLFVPDIERTISTPCSARKRILTAKRLPRLGKADEDRRRTKLPSAQRPLPGRRRYGRWSQETRLNFGSAVISRHCLSSVILGVSRSGCAKGPPGRFCRVEATSRPGFPLASRRAGARSFVGPHSIPTRPIRHGARSRK